MTSTDPRPDEIIDQRNQLVLHHLPLVFAVYRRMKRSGQLRGMGSDEALSHGGLALLKAAESFDSGRGVPFQAYAGEHVRYALLRATRRRRIDLVTVTFSALGGPN